MRNLLQVRPGTGSVVATVKFGEQGNPNIHNSVLQNLKEATNLNFYK